MTLDREGRVIDFFQEETIMKWSGKTFHSGVVFFNTSGLTTEYVCIETAVSDTCCHRTSSQTPPAGVGSGIFDSRR